MITKEIVTAYLETLLWSETFHGMGDDGEEPLIIEGTEYEPGTPLDQIQGCDVSDLATLAPKLLEEAEEDLEGFRAYCLEDIGIDPFKFFDPSQVAHDFALSRNGHGAGFFDREYTISPTGPAGKPSSLRAVRYADSKPGDVVSLSDALQAAAKTFGTCGLDVWTDEAGNLKMESHG
jgi:hypothetical protein